jgi:hypothetical protein
LSASFAVRNTSIVSVLQELASCGSAPIFKLEQTRYTRFVPANYNPVAR